MFDILINFVKSNFSKRDLTLETIDNFDDIKLSIVLSKKELKMASIEILIDGTCDFMIVDYLSESVLYSRTINIKDIEELKTELINFIDLL